MNNGDEKRQNTARNASLAGVERPSSQTAHAVPVSCPLLLFCGHRKVRHKDSRKAETAGGMRIMVFGGAELLCLGLLFVFC